MRATAEAARVLKPEGSLWINLGDKYNSAASEQNGTGTTGMTGGRHDKMPGRGTVVAVHRKKTLLGLPWRYAIRCVDELGLILRAEVIWQKPNGLPESVNDRVRRSHETWFHFTKQPRYYSAVDEIRERHQTVAPGARSTGGTGYEAHMAGRMNGSAHLLGKLPGSVWSIPTQPLNVPEHIGVDHFAAFPMEWPRRIIKAWCPPGGVVLDPFGGTGTTALVADALGRHGISVDMSADYLRIAQWRTTDPRQRAKAAQRGYTPPPRQLPGQVAFTF